MNSNSTHSQDLRVGTRMKLTKVQLSEANGAVMTHTATPAVASSSSGSGAGRSSSSSSSSPSTTWSLLLQRFSNLRVPELSVRGRPLPRWMVVGGGLVLTAAAAAAILALLRRAVRRRRSVATQTAAAATRVASIMHFEHRGASC